MFHPLLGPIAVRTEKHTFRKQLGGQRFRSGAASLVRNVHPAASMEGRALDETFTDAGDGGSLAPCVPVPVLVLVLEAQRPEAGGWCVSLTRTRSVEIGRGARRAGASRPDGDLRLEIPDPRMSTVHVRLVRDGGRWIMQDADSKNGLVVNGDRVSSWILTERDLVQLGASFFLFRTYRLDPSAPISDQRGAFATFDLELAEKYQQASRVARSMVSVLVTGESGTGKELVARELHRRSGRAGPFVAVNCGAIAPTLIESELFGYRRGAFSGAADDQQGLVRGAHGGTLFLDEVAELSSHGQVALLRMLQERTVRPVGAIEEIPVDVRIVAATHQDLEDRVANGAFRQDLYARLVGFTLEVPSLRHRRVDLGLLVASLLARIAKNPIKLSAAAARALLDYGFPMNVRELEQTLRSAAALCSGGEISLADLPPRLRTSEGTGAGYLRPDDERLRDQLVTLLREHQGNVAATGRAMGKAPVQIRRWCRRLGIDVGRHRE